jgi:polysaccharide export outer membrane protein
MKFLRSLLILFFPLYIISCTTQQKTPNYIQNVTDTSGKGALQIPVLRIQKDDLLSIQIYSTTTKTEVDAIYNLGTVASNPSGQGSSGSASSPGFLVDADGNIHHPKLGVIHVEGLTKEEVANEIKKRLTEPVKLLDDPTVIIRFQNLKITVIGEVNKQGVVTIPSERVTILEAVGLAGGLTDYAVKNSVKVIRENDGKRDIGIIDLSSKTLFESPYYTLRQNDIVIVDPTARKSKKADQDLVIQRVSFGLSVITAIALVYNIFK